MSEHAGNLTDTNFWSDYWKSVTLPARLDLSDPGTRSLAGSIDLILMSRRQKAKGEFHKLAEIGCAPGAWLTHFARRGFEITGIDSSPRGARLTRDNLEMQHIKGEVIEADAIELEEERLRHSFDVVFSLGVVEHFEDPRPIFNAHKRLVSPNGTVIVVVPNLRYLNGWLQRTLDATWLGIHNIEILKPRRLVEIGRSVGLETQSVEYAGGFDPNLFEWRHRSYLGFATTRAGKLIRRMRCGDEWNSKWFSSMIVIEYTPVEMGR